MTWLCNGGGGRRRIATTATRPETAAYSIQHCNYIQYSGRVVGVFLCTESSVQYRWYTRRRLNTKHGVGSQWWAEGRRSWLVLDKLLHHANAAASDCWSSGCWVGCAAMRLCYLVIEARKIDAVQMKARSEGEAILPAAQHTPYTVIIRAKRWRVRGRRAKRAGVMAKVARTSSTQLDPERRRQRRWREIGCCGQGPFPPQNNKGGEGYIQYVHMYVHAVRSTP